MKKINKVITAVLTISAALVLANCDVYAVGAHRTVQTAYPDPGPAGNPH